MRVDAGLISYLEELSALALSDEEKRRLSDDLEEILGYMASLSGLDTKEIQEQDLSFDNEHAFREDAVTPSLPREKLLQNAPFSTNGMLAAPRTV